jgi:hypothetical protein
MGSVNDETQWWCTGTQISLVSQTLTEYWLLIEYLLLVMNDAVLDFQGWICTLMLKFSYLTKKEIQPTESENTYESGLF